MVYPCRMKNTQVEYRSFCKDGPVLASNAFFEFLKLLALVNVNM